MSLLEYGRSFLQLRFRWVFLFIILVCSACQPSNQPVVVVYTSVDQPFAEPVLNAFEEQTGIQVQAVYDVEAAKTTGMVNRLIAEKDTPQADIFWNSEILQTLLLKDHGVLAVYASPEAKVLPPAFRDPDGYWTGIGGRARVWIINTERVPDPKNVDSLFDLLDTSWSGSDIGLAIPMFGTAATQAAVLYAAWGPDRARSFFQQSADRGIRLLDGNSVVRDLVASGSLAFGLTDTDDACAALAEGAPVQIMLPDQSGEGTLLIPGSVALIQGAPHPQQAQALIDYLLSAQVAQDLVDSGFNHLPIHPSVKPAEDCIGAQSVRLMQVDFNQAYSLFAMVQTELREIFIK